MPKKISVIVPVYNVEPYLARCLDSIIGQTYQNLEIICVNDGSPDNCAAILQEYARKDERIIVVDKPNGGLSSARNAGMARATGEYIAFVDSDDHIEPSCYASCMEHFTDDVDVVSHNFTLDYETGEKKPYLQQLHGKIQFSEDMLFKQSAGVWSKIYRFSALKAFGMRFREGILYEDLEFNARYFLTARPTVVYLEPPFYHYCQYSHSIMGQTFKLKKGMSIQHIYLLDSIHDYLKEHDTLGKNLNDFFSLCEYCFHAACKFAPADELTACYKEMTARLRRYDLDYSGRSLLSKLHQGRYTSTLLRKIIEKKLRLKRLERLLSIKNESGFKTVRVFGAPILRIKKR